MADLSTILSSMRAWCPESWTESWDKVGLQIGPFKPHIDRVALTVTVDQQLISQAVDQKTDLIISHHPVIFEPLQTINPSTYEGQLVSRLVQSKISVYIAHTNLDVAPGGVNDVLADLYGMRECRAIQERVANEWVKLVVFIPEDHFEGFREKLLKLPIGHIGNYSDCSFSVPGEGTFRPGDGTTPYTGDMHVQSRVPERRFETIVRKTDLPHVLPQMIQAHPYEEVAYDIYPILEPAVHIGLGRIGDIDEQTVGDLLSIYPGTVKGTCDIHKPVRRIAVCGGNGSSLIDQVVNKGVDCYVTGDIGYHAGVRAKDMGLTIIDIGHEESERLILTKIKERLLTDTDLSADNVIVC